MAVITYNDRLRQLLANVECVLAFDTAADFLGLTNGGYRTAAQIFVNKSRILEERNRFWCLLWKRLSMRNGTGCDARR